MVITPMSRRLRIPIMMGNKDFIDVGIATSGNPIMHCEGDLTVLENQLIGVGFHWQREIESRLPGEILATSDPLFTIVNRLPVETYLECVVGSEMNPAAPIEFLRAHAVISRSWAMGKMSRAGRKNSAESGKIISESRIVNWEDEADHHDFHVCSDDHCQRYQGIQPISDAAREALRSTRGEVLRDGDGNIVDARFSKCCGGVTELFSTCWQDEERPGLRSFEDPWCDLSGMDAEERGRFLKTVLKDYDTANGGGYLWETSINKEDIRRHLREKFGRDIGEIESMAALDRGPSGRIKLLLLKGSRGNLEIGKELMIRKLLSESHLYSSAMEWEDRGGSYLLHGRGWGHGVGLCQIGAAAMARAGHTYREILSFYYPATTLSKC